MRWFRHSNFTGMHSEHLSASNYHWLNYDDDKFDRMFEMRKAASLGTRKHAFAAEAISLKVPLRNNGTTLSLYVNHAIGFGMRAEQTLVYSSNAFGTADAISFKKKKLRVHDLKTGAAATSFKQLECYAALFCLEYMEDPFQIEIELRIYQNDGFKIHVPDAGDIKNIMENYKRRSKRVDYLEREEDVL